VLAKIAADMRKPFDQYRVTDIETFLHDLPIRKVREVPVETQTWARMAIIRGQSWHIIEFDLDKLIRLLVSRQICGIGRVTERVLGEALGIQTCGQLYEQRALLFACFRPGTASWFLSRCVHAMNNLSFAPRFRPTRQLAGSGLTHKCIYCVLTKSNRSMGLGSIRDEEDSGKEGRKGISREETFRAIR
jgi:hypothetical protein